MNEMAVKKGVQPVFENVVPTLKANNGEEFLAKHFNSQKQRKSNKLTHQCQCSSCVDNPFPAVTQEALVGTESSANQQMMEENQAQQIFLRQ